MNSNYSNKYRKYKSKYTNLIAKQMGGFPMYDDDDEKIIDELTKLAVDVKTKFANDKNEIKKYFEMLLKNKETIGEGMKEFIEAVKIKFGLKEDKDILTSEKLMSHMQQIIKADIKCLEKEIVV
jgi:hypothetical protein